MKKIIIAALLACMTLAFAGCGGNNTKEESKGQVSIAESSVQDSSAQESSKEESSKEESSKQESSKNESPAEESSKADESKAEVSEEKSEAPAVVQPSEEPSQTLVTVTTQEVPVEQSQQQEQPSEQEQSTQQEQPSQQLEPQYGAFSTQDLSVTYNGNTIALLSTADEMVAAFGNASGVESVPSCLSMDAPDDKIYHYGSFDAQSLTENGTEKVYNFDIKGAGVSTSRNISVGSSKADVESAYGKTSSSDDFSSVYTVGDGRKSLEFYYENGKVTEIILAYAP